MQPGAPYVEQFGEFQARSSPGRSLPNTARFYFDRASRRMVLSEAAGPYEPVGCREISGPLDDAPGLAAGEDYVSTALSRIQFGSLQFVPDELPTGCWYISIDDGATAPAAAPAIQTGRLVDLPAELEAGQRYLSKEA